MSSADSQTLFVVTADYGRAERLTYHFPRTEIVHVSNAETLLREAHITPPNVALLYADTPGVPLSEVLPILRKRAELMGTYWLAVGGATLGSYLSAGADALISENTSLEALVVQIKTLLKRAHVHAEDQYRIGNLQRKLENSEHDETVRDQLVHMLVHDLKNPIAAVMGLLEIVHDDNRVPEDARELLKVARDETQHLLHLAVNILDVRKIQAGKMNLRREFMFSPMFAEVIEQARGDVGSGLQARKMQVNVQNNLSPASADPEILRRVLANLISNAMKHTVSGGSITILVQAAGDAVKVTVKDNGEGIPAEDLPKLFAAFEQSRLTLHGRFDTGMGLAFCKLAIEQHGGLINVESERGKGSSFYFTLPIAVDDEDDYVELIH